MGLDPELRGANATWTFTADAVRIVYARTRSTPKLLQNLGTRTVPFAAIAAVEVAGGVGKPELCLTLRPGTDPLLDVADGQLAFDEHPDRLLLDRGDLDLATWYRDYLEDARPTGTGRERGPLLVAPPATSRRLRGADGEMIRDGDAVVLRWNDDATSLKRRAGESTWPLADVDDVEWSRPGMLSGHLRLDDRAAGRPPRVEDDLRALTFGLGLGTAATTLPFAADLLDAVRRTGREAQAIRGGVAGDDPVAALRTLETLRAEGVLDPEEFTSRRSRLLDRIDGTSR